MPKQSPLDRDIISGRIQFFDVHWDGHKIMVKGIVNGTPTGPGWKHGQGDTLKEAVAAFYDAVIGEDLI